LPKRKASFLDKSLLAIFQKNEHSPVAIELFVMNNTPKHRRKIWSFYGIFFRGAPRGVAAIEQPR
jgi:hypothetical protein